MGLWSYSMPQSQLTDSPRPFRFFYSFLSVEPGCRALWIPPPPRSVWAVLMPGSVPIPGILLVHGISRRESSPETNPLYKSKGCRSTSIVRGTRPEWDHFIPSKPKPLQDLPFPATPTPPVEVTILSFPIFRSINWLMWQPPRPVDALVDLSGS